eukprot:5419061-Prorocentrum_lima.AAC.1
MCIRDRIPSTRSHRNVASEHQPGLGGSPAYSLLGGASAVSRPAPTARSLDMVPSGSTSRLVMPVRWQRQP